MRITPYFEINETRYEFKRTRWLIAEHRRLSDENPLSEEDKANTVKASNLVADVKKYAEKAKECWDKLCEDPTEENERVYNLFKRMSDSSIEKYNEFIVSNNALQNATKHTIEILEKVAIKALAEQYYDMNETFAKRTWEEFVESNESREAVDEWLNAMAECLFAEDEEENEDTGFLAQKRKADNEREMNRKSALGKKR
jgi:hypothetical protein